MKSVARQGLALIQLCLGFLLPRRNPPDGERRGEQTDKEDRQKDPG